jgi:hypothetical protein
MGFWLRERERERERGGESRAEREGGSGSGTFLRQPAGTAGGSPTSTPSRPRETNKAIN